MNDERLEAIRNYIELGGGISNNGARVLLAALDEATADAQRQHQLYEFEVAEVERLRAERDEWRKMWEKGGPELMAEVERLRGALELLRDSLKPLARYPGTQPFPYGAVMNLQGIVRHALAEYDHGRPPPLSAEERQKRAETRHRGVPAEYDQGATE
jgi:hypothetical protein